MAYVVGCDIGTQGTKALVVDEAGRVLARALREYPLRTPAPGWAEQDPEVWHRGAGEAVAEAVSRSGVPVSEIVALGLSGQMHSSVLLDGKGEVVRPALLWCDTRTTAECAQITREVGEAELRRHVGNPALEGFTLPKLLWVRRHEPAAWRRIRTVLLPKDYVRYRWTGELLTEVSDAAGTLAFDVRRRRWAVSLLSRLKVPPEWFSPVRESQDPCGSLTAAAARSLGLRAGTPVVGGGADNPAAAVGCGVVKPGDVLVSLGTSGVVYAAVPELPKADPRMRLHAFCSCVPGENYLMGVMLAAGYCLRWYRDTLGISEKEAALREGKDPYDVLSAAAAEIPEGCEGLLFLPYLMGERTPHRDAAARAAFVGVGVRHGRAHFARAIFEGVAFGLRDSLELLRARKVPVRRVVATGGGAKSPFWRQVLADVFGREIRTVEGEEGPAFGAALLALVGAGLQPSVQEACARLVRESGVTEPRKESVKRYGGWYGEWRRLYPVLKGSFAAIHRKL